MKTIQWAIRNLLRNKLYSGINVLGLTLSLAGFLILSCYIHQEMTVDHFCKYLNRTYLLTIQEENGNLSTGSLENRQHAEGFKNLLDDPAIEFHTRYRISNNDIITYNQYDYTADVLITDNYFLQLFPYPVKKGSVDFSHPGSALLTEELAHKIFGNTNPLGKTFEYNGKVLTVNGILGNPATKASITFDLIIPVTFQEEWNQSSDDLIVLYPNINYKTFNEKYSTFIPHLYHWAPSSRYQLFPLKGFYFNTAISSSYMQGGDKSALWVLSVISLLIITIGLFNFINLYTVIIMKRHREFGVKKVYGAGPDKIFTQIFTENILLTGCSLGLSWFFIEIFYWGSEKWLDLELRSYTGFNLTITISLLVGISLLSVLYPFLKYSYTPTIISIRSISLNNHSLSSRMFILSFQYIITCSLIIASLFFMKQLHYMLHTEPGYQVKDIISTEIVKWRKGLIGEERRKEEIDNQQRIAFLRQKIRENPLFLYQTGRSNPNLLYSYKNFRKEGSKFHPIALDWVTNDYFALYNIQLKEGRLWDNEIDKEFPFRMIINETAQKLFDIQVGTDFIQPEELVWRIYYKNLEVNTPFQIIGVVKDFQVGHLSQKIPPVAFLYGGKEDTNSYITAAIAPGKRQEAIAFLKELHDEYANTGDFSYTFMEDQIKRIYTRDKEIVRIYILFACIAILISCIGLFGISLFDIEKRYKEISIRKVNGASSVEIFFLLMKKYIWLLSISFLIAIPISYLGIHIYLRNFANKATLSWWIYGIACTLTFLISFLTFFYQIRKAARMNPAKAIKTE